MLQLTKISIKRFLHNLYRHFVYDEIAIYGCKDDVDKMKNDLFFVKNQLEDQKLINKIIFDYIKRRDETYLNELNFLVENGFSNFPYEQVNDCPLPRCGYDEKRELPFVFHNGKKLYFCSDFTSESAAEKYKYYIEKENLLGGGYTEKAPHQYQTESFKIEKGDVLIDMGCAEALLSLDVIEKLEHAYLIECDSKWIPALEATFEPYKNKVTIINKYVGDVDNDETIRLDTILPNEMTSPVFIKMDIEGTEVKVLQDSIDYLKKHNDIKITCCTYHYDSDYEKIVEILSDAGFICEDSDGYMLFSMYDQPISPFFRKGLVRANKNCQGLICPIR